MMSRFSHKMTPKKFSLIPGNISRFFILMVIVLLATMGVMIQSAVNAWLKEKAIRWLMSPRSPPAH
ncbi:two-component sensor protein RcsD [Klebsiella pneumoniae]|uniref:Two-component sensor protein RcsD n=1 Tax=Klebsiella pneumoniae TaxID=573 RepID=A0A2X3F2J0_KLEPN|nr:two-component sensor protein RcsD [Klebsiella pneumoniae]